MADSQKRLTREELLSALEAGWGRFLSSLAKWSEDKQTIYAVQQGYPRVQDLIAHVCAWSEETLRVVPLLHSRQLAEQEYDIDMFNARAVTRYQPWTRARIEARFEELRLALAELIRTLPASALDDESVYAWLFETAVEHYREHRPPGGPRLP